MYICKTEDAFDHWMLKRAKWTKKFALFPKTCCFSKKRIWLEYAYVGERILTGPGDPIFLYYWLTPKNYVILTLKGMI